MNNFRVLIVFCLVSFFATTTLAQNKKFDKSLKKIDGYYAAGELEKASSALRKLKSSISSKMGASNPYMPGLLIREARINLTMGSLAEFDKAMQAALKESKQVFGENSNNYAKDLLQVAEMYNEYGNFRIARDYVEQSKAILSKTQDIEESLKGKIALIESEAMIGQGFSTDAIELLNSWEKFFLQRAVDKETRVENNEIKSIRVPDAEIFERFNAYAKLKTLLGSAYAQKGKISLAGMDEENIDVDDVFSELDKWVKGKKRFFGETSLAEVEYNFVWAKALVENVASLSFDKDLQFSNILSDLKKKTDPTNELAHEIYLSYLQYLLRQEYNAKYLSTRLEYEKVIEKSFPKTSVHRLNLKAVEFNSKITKDKTKNLEGEAYQVLQSKSLPKNYKTTILILNFLHEIAIAEKKYPNAETYLSQIVEAQKELCGENSPVYHLARIDLANFYLDYTNKIDEAGKIYETSYFKVVKNQIAAQHPKILPILNHIATWYELTDRYADASKTLKEAKETVYIKFSAGKEDILLAQELDQIAQLQLKLGEYDQAGENIEEANRIVDLKKNRDYDIWRETNVSVLETKAKLFAIKGMFDEAKAALKSSNRLIEKSKEKVDEQSTNAELAPLLIMLGETRSADNLLIEQIPSYEQVYGPNSLRLIDPLINKSRVLLAEGDYTEAEKVAQRARQIAVKTYSENSTKSAPAQKMLGEIFYILGDYEKAEEQVNKALASQEKQFGRNHIEVAKSLSQLSLIKFYKGDNKKTVEKLMLEAQNIMVDRLGKENPQYAEILKNVAVVYISEKRYDIAFNALTNAESIWKKKTGSKNNINLASIYTLTGDVYYQTKSYKRSEEFYIQAKDLYEKFFSVNHPEYVKVLSKLSKVYFMQKDYKRSKKYIEEALGNYEKFIQLFFPALSERQKAKYWNTMRSDFEFYNTLAFSNLEDFKDLSGKVYNYQLLTKALLLSSSIKIRERILNSSDEDLKSQYNLWVQKKEQLTLALSMSAEQLAENEIDPASLQQEVERLEKELSQKSELFGQSFESKRITFDDVRKSLRQNEVAIEMVRYRNFNHTLTDSVVYAALYLKADMNKPKVILMSDGKKMETRYFKYYRNSITGKVADEISYGIYWKPIQDVIGQASTIYLSADGVYNQINLESIPTPDGKYIIDNSNIVLVSNSKDLYLRKITSRSKGNGNTASMFGNPTFYKTAVAHRGISSLPGTEKEVSQVQFMLKQKGWVTAEYVEATASEENVKSLNSPKIFHIATHGFYRPQAITTEDELEGNEAMMTRNPLLRTGLLLTGAGDLMDRSQHNYNIESGILTADEAMSLNLDKTDLVVLSACETGLGDLEAGEGVYGLQRAFLVAGAKVLIMSMFKVDDDATQQLMLKFYQKWLNSENLRESFIEAKKELRLTYPEPIYWGAFMMIGLD
jgi:CHAT domain-containing protein